MIEVYIGEIHLFAFNYAPAGWAFCNGQSVGISQNQALFALLGTTFGGNGTTTFNLPDLRGRSAIHYGQGPGLSSIVMGQSSGTENITLLQTNIPAHAHVLVQGTGVGQVNLVTNANATTGGTISNETDGGNNSFSSGSQTANVYSEPGTGTTKIGGITSTISGTTSIVGSSLPFNSRNPYLGVNMCISLQGVYPSRN